MNAKKSENGEVLQNGNFFDPMAVTWTEKYSNQIDAVWKKLPSFVAKFLATFAVLLLSATLKGDWVAILVHIAKQVGFAEEDTIPGNGTFNLSEISLESLRLKNVLYYWVGAIVVSYLLYFGVGGFLHWYFYVRQRDKAEQWKLQPLKWLPPELERHEILLGSSTLLLNASISALVACYISNGGYSTVYYDFFEYPVWWLLLQIAVIFIYQDYVTYWLHRWYHTPWLYKHFHKLHHKYKQPTAFSVTAIHPVESLHIQLTLMLPLIVIPIHWLTFYSVVMYTYYHGIIDHSGVNFKAYWWQPWQPDAIFHDNHHQYTHVNFGFNIEFWDKLHGTYRRKDRIYKEDIFYGKGKPLSEATAEELKEDMEERQSENPLAYRENELVYKLSDAELAEVRASRKNNKKIN